jgi:hypothetical protein
MGNSKMQPVSAEEFVRGLLTTYDMFARGLAHQHTKEQYFCTISEE